MISNYGLIVAKTFEILLTVMKFEIAAPSQITDNNVGDIINVGIDADLNLSNKINVDKYSLDVLVKNLQAILLGDINLPNLNDDDRFPGLPTKGLEISPELIQAFLKKMQR
ncbi:hypothetical protein ACKWTF_005144 [Chironomus riparius]